VPASVTDVTSFPRIEHTMFPLNSKVRLKGLMKEEFNGKFGVVRSSPDENTGRLNVYIPDFGKSVALRSVNVESVAATGEVGTMGIKELKAELTSYGLATSSYCEKTELQEAVAQARRDGYKKPTCSKKAPTIAPCAGKIPAAERAKTLPRAVIAAKEERNGNVRIIRDVAGIEGLHVALDVFSEETERRLFDHQSMFPVFPADHNGNDRKRQGKTVSPLDWPVDIYRLCNAIRDCGLVSRDFVFPDYAYGINYPPLSRFMNHHDSPFKWGETVVGVSLGLQSTFNMTFDQHSSQRPKPVPAMPIIPKGYGIEIATKKEPCSGSFSVDITLPRRSIYCFSGSARVDWKHGVRSQPGNPINCPHWNPHCLRRSITFRSNKSYSDLVLKDLVSNNPGNAMLKQRFHAQSNIRTDGAPKKMSRKIVAFMKSNPVRDARFSPNEANYDVPSVELNTSSQSQANNVSDSQYQQWLDAYISENFRDSRPESVITNTLRNTHGGKNKHASVGVEGSGKRYKSTDS